MKKIKAVLRFSPELVEEPVIYALITGYGLRVNILRAAIDTGKQGRMVVDLEGDSQNLDQGLAYLDRLGVEVQSLSTQIGRAEEACTSCTACIPHCPTGALNVDRQATWKVGFDADRCIVCLSCVEVCISKAMTVGENSQRTD